MQKPFTGIGGRFTGLPSRLRSVSQLLANPGVITDGQWIHITDTIEDAALKIEALEREAAVAKLEPTS